MFCADGESASDASPNGAMPVRCLFWRAFDMTGTGSAVPNSPQHGMFVVIDVATLLLYDIILSTNIDWIMS